MAEVEPPEGGPVVDVAAKIFSLTAVDVIQSLFDIEVRLVFDWREPSLARAGGERRKMRADEWDRALFSPQPLLQNGTRDLSIKAGSIDVWPDGRVSQSWDFRGRLMHEFDLRRFPLDSQTLTVQLRLKQWKGRYVEPRFSETRPSLIDVVLLPEWRVSRQVRAFVVASDPAASTQALSYNELHVAVHCARVPDTYAWNLGLIVLMIQFLAFAAFSIEPREVADRVNTLLTLVLAAVAVRFVVAEQLPKSPYLTLFEKYLISSFASLFVVTVGVFALPWYLRDDPDETLKRWDDRLAVAAAAGFAVQHSVVAAVWFRERHRLDRRFRKGAKIAESWRVGSRPEAGAETAAVEMEER